MSSGAQVKLRYRAETTFSALETGEKFKDYGFTSETLKASREYIPNPTISGTRQITKGRNVGRGAGGQISGLLAYTAHDDFLKAGILSAAWTSEVTATGTIYSAASADNSFNRASGDFVAAGYLAGRWLKVSGFATAGNNGLCRIVSVATTKIIVQGLTLTNESAGPTVTVAMGAHIRNGTTKESFNIEKEFSDLSNEFAIYDGMNVNSWSVNQGLRQYVTVNFDFIGADEASTTATTGDGSPTAAATTDAIATDSSGISAILENSASLCTVDFNLNWNNNGRTQECQGMTGVEAINFGVPSCTGSISGYYTTKTRYDKFLNGTETSLAVIYQDAAGNKLVVDLPRVVLTDGNRNSSGNDADVLDVTPFEASSHATYGLSLIHI